MFYPKLYRQYASKIRTETEVLNGFSNFNILHNVFLLHPLAFSHVHVVKISFDNIFLQNSLQEWRLTSRLSCTKHLKTLFSMFSELLNFCFFVFSSRIFYSYSDCWSTCHPSSSTKIYLRLFHKRSASKEHYTVCTASHFSSWGVNNIKRASAGFNANTIIHSAQCESTSCPRWRRKYCQRGANVSLRKTIFASELKVTCRGAAPHQPLHGTLGSASSEERSREWEIAELNSGKGAQSEELKSHKTLQDP